MDYTFQTNNFSNTGYIPYYTQSNTTPLNDNLYGDTTGANRSAYPSYLSTSTYIPPTSVTATTTLPENTAAMDNKSSTGAAKKSAIRKNQTQANKKAGNPQKQGESNTDGIEVDIGVKADISKSAILQPYMSPLTDYTGTGYGGNTTQPKTDIYNSSIIPLGKPSSTTSSSLPNFSSFQNTAEYLNNLDKRLKELEVKFGIKTPVNYAPLPLNYKDFTYVEPIAPTLPKPDAIWNTPKPDATWNAPKPDATWNAPKPDTTWNAPKPDATWNAPKPDTTWNAPKSDTTWSAPNTETSWNPAKNEPGAKKSAAVGGDHLNKYNPAPIAPLDNKYDNNFDTKYPSTDNKPLYGSTYGQPSYTPNQYGAYSNPYSTNYNLNPYTSPSTTNNYSSLYNPTPSYTNPQPTTSYTNPQPTTSYTNPTPSYTNPTPSYTNPTTNYSNPYNVGTTPSYTSTFNPAPISQPPVNTYNSTTNFNPSSSYNPYNLDNTYSYPGSTSYKPLDISKSTPLESKPLLLDAKFINSDQKTLKLESKTILSDYGTVKTAKDFVDDPNSEYNQLVNRLRSTNQKYKDPQFPPELKSLISGKDESEIAWNAGDLVWKRPDDFYGQGNYKIYEGGVSVDDIKQGELGDCYFLSTLAALAEFPHRIERLFVNKEINDQGCYAVRICDMGEWQEVILDDYFPCYSDDNSLTFAKGNGGELWVLLLEKAWAKLYGSYAKIEAGLTREALHDLTGAPTKYYNLSNIKGIPDETEKLWRDLLHGDQHDFVLTCGSYGSDDSEARDGIFFGHAYSLISIHEANNNGSKLRLLRIRNPHSHGEWTGNWSDHSPLWTPEIKRQVNYKDEDDGTFFMSYDDFFEYFEDVEICKVHDDYHYNSLRVTGISHKNAGFFKITIVKDGKYYITANQQSKRHHEDQENFEHSPVWVMLAKHDGNGGYEYIEGVYKADREVFTDGHLTQGEYIVYVKAAWFDEKKRDFVLSVYGPDDAKIAKISKSECKDFIHKVFMHRAKKSKKSQNYNAQGHPNCIKVSEATDEGYVYIYYQNKSNKTLVETVTFNVLEGRKLCKPHRGNRYEIRVAPGEEKIVLLKEDYWAEDIRHSLSTNTRFEQSK